MFGERDDPERIRLQTERDLSTHNWLVALKVRKADVIQDMMMPAVSESQVKSVSVSAIHVRDESDLTTKMESTGLILDVDVNREDSEQIESLGNEVSISLLEPSHKIDHMQFALFENYNPQLLCNESRSDQIFGVLSAPKLEQAYILDVDMREDLTLKVIGGVNFVAHQVHDQLLLRVDDKIKQRKYQKSWMFKYRLKQALRIQLSSDKHGIKRAMKLQETEGMEEYHRRFELWRTDLRLPEANLVKAYLQGLEMDTGLRWKELLAGFMEHVRSDDTWDMLRDELAFSPPLLLSLSHAHLHSAFLRLMLLFQHTTSLKVLTVQELEQQLHRLCSGEFTRSQTELDTVSSLLQWLLLSSWSSRKGESLTKDQSDLEYVKVMFSDSNTFQKLPFCHRKIYSNEYSAQVQRWYINALEDSALRHIDQKRKLSKTWHFKYKLKEELQITREDPVHTDITLNEWSRHKWIRLMMHDRMIAVQLVMEPLPVTVYMSQYAPGCVCCDKHVLSFVHHFTKLIEDQIKTVCLQVGGVGSIEPCGQNRWRQHIIQAGSVYATDVDQLEEVHGHWRMENLFMRKGLSGLYRCNRVWGTGGVLTKLAKWTGLETCHGHGWMIQRCVGKVTNLPFDPGGVVCLPNSGELYVEWTEHL